MWRAGCVPDVILCFGGAIGDDLICTVVARELKKSGKKNIWMCTLHPQIFIGNTDVSHTFSYNPWVSRLQELWPKMVPILVYSEYNSVIDQGSSPDEHIIAVLCRKVGIRGVIDFQPHLNLSSDELEQQRWASGYVAIQSSGMEAVLPMLNKQWFFERFQAVVNELSLSHRVVQLGGDTNPLLYGALDMRGRTSVRESAAILAHCRLYIGTVGLLMHLARSVNCPSVIVYGGRERPYQSGYNCNINLSSFEPCSPCWRYSKCDYDRICMDKVSVEDVIGGANACLSRYPSGKVPQDSVDSFLIV
jgi:hypothetical protein